MTRRRFLHVTSMVSLTVLAGCFQSSSCDPTCFEGEYEGWDDALNRMTITHAGGDPLPANEVYITGVADKYPPEPESGEERSWADVSNFDPTDNVEEGDSVTVDVGFVDKVVVYWRHDGDKQKLAELNAD